MPIPPWREVWDLFRDLIAPTLIASAVVMLILRLVGRERFSSLAAALALISGIVVGNYFCKAIPWSVDSDRALTVHEWWATLNRSLAAPDTAQADSDDDNSQPPPAKVSARYWLPWLAGLAMLVELVLPVTRYPLAIGSLARLSVAVFAAILLTPADYRGVFWITACLAGAIFLEWTILTLLARHWDDGTVAAAMTFCLLAGGFLTLYAHSLRFMNMALLLAYGLLGPALVAFVRPTRTAPALASVALFLPGLMLCAFNETYSAVTSSSFLLAGLCPLAAAPLLAPPLLRFAKWKRWLLGMGLPLIPAVIAVILAAQVESIAMPDSSNSP